MLNRKIYRATYAESVSAVDKSSIHELNSGEKVFEFDTVVIKLPGPTRNKVMYPLEEMKKAVASAMVQELLNRGAMYGEGGHPLNPKDIDRWVVVPMDKAQFKWTKLWFDGDTLMGRVRTYPGNGNLLAKAIINGELPAFSIRVLGSEHMENGYRTLRDIILITIDWVNYPGNPNSYVPDSKEFMISDAPLFTMDYDYTGRTVPKGESYNLLDVKDNETLVSLGEGYFTKVSKIDKDQRSKLKAFRENAF
jgi:hypothetical protein